MTILAKTYFCRSPVFTMEKNVFPPSGKNLPTLLSTVWWYCVCDIIAKV